VSSALDSLPAAGNRLNPNLRVQVGIRLHETLNFQAHDTAGMTGWVPMLQTVIAF
jgi:hypothetical protein